jgi:hypothetical protein
LPALPACSHAAYHRFSASRAHPDFSGWQNHFLAGGYSRSPIILRSSLRARSSERLISYLLRFHAMPAYQSALYPLINISNEAARSAPQGGFFEDFIILFSLIFTVGILLCFCPNGGF